MEGLLQVYFLEGHVCLAHRGGGTTNASKTIAPIIPKSV